MTLLTILVKASHGGQRRAIDEALKTQFEDLDLKIEILGFTANKWVQVSLEGEDEAIATNYIKKTYGTAPFNLDNARTMQTLRGYITKIDNTKQEIYVDVGVLEPQVAPAVLSVAALQTQLVEGKKLPLEKIAELYGLAEGLPIAVWVNWEKSSEGELSAELSAEQAAKFASWRRSLMDRLIILGASRETVDSVLERTRLTRDVVDVEALGAFEYALTCKLGTDAAGLIPKMGRYLRNSVFVVFRAEKAWSF